MKAGYIEIPANTSPAQVNFETPFNGTYSIAITNLYSYSQKIIYSTSSVESGGFKIHPYDESIGKIPTVKTSAFWIAVRRKS